MSQYKMARGVLRRPSDPKAPRKSVSTAAEFIGQGEEIPDGMLSPREVETLLAQGVIEAVGAVGTSESAVAAKRGKWSVDPVALVGKSLEDLLVMVLEIDENYAVDQLDSVAAAVAQLTADWHPAFREQLALSNDRTRPAPLRQVTKRNDAGRVVEVHGARDAGTPEMSDVSKAFLDQARERAATTAPHTQEPKG